MRHPPARTRRYRAKLPRLSEEVNRQDRLKSERRSISSTFPNVSTAFVESGSGRPPSHDNQEADFLASVLRMLQHFTFHGSRH